MLKRYAAAVAGSLRQVRYGILAALCVYVVGSLAGGWYADRLHFLQPAAEGLVDTFQGKGPINFVVSLFLHNLTATYITMCLITLWGVVPLVAAAGNGLLLGWVVVTIIESSPADAAALLVPHGMFEWPAMLTAWGVGLWRGVGYRFDHRPSTYLERWKRANRIYFFVVLPLLLIAAVVEGRARIIGIILG